MTLTSQLPVVESTEKKEQNHVKEEECTAFLEYAREEFASFDGADNYNRIAAKAVPVRATRDTLTCEMIIAREHVNTKGTLHGGQTASLIDIITARAVGITVKDRGMASIELSVSYLAPVKLGDTILMTATVLKCGRNVAFTECEFRNKTDGKLCVKGKHTLALLPGEPPVVNGKLAQF